MTLHPVMFSIPSAQNLDSAGRVGRQRRFSRAALRRCAELSGAPLDGWEQDERGAGIANEGFHWSVSHKPDYAAAIISTEPVGIDIERIKPRTSDHFDEVGSDEGWGVLGGRSLENFFKLWTAKEAALKAEGVGMAGWDRCRVVSVNQDGAIQLTCGEATYSVLHSQRGDHVVAVTAGAGGVEWHWEQDVSRVR